jgi:hypothetical protein
MKRNYPNGLVLRPRFAEEAMKSSGYTLLTSIGELIDNSIDANSNNIWLERFKQKDGRFSFSIRDDGDGIDSSRMLECFVELGQGDEMQYEANRIGKFGVGGIYARQNLSEDGEVIYQSIKDGKKSILFWGVKELAGSEIQKEKTDEKNGTLIFFPNISSKEQKSTILKYIGCTYFPHSRRNKSYTSRKDKSFHIWFKDYDDKDFLEISFLDPLYRHLDEGIFKNEADIPINGGIVNLKVYTFLKNFDISKCHEWDTFGGKPNLKKKNSGVYWKMPGRYLTLGNADFIIKSNNRSPFDYTRVEISIDRDIAKECGVMFKKDDVKVDFDRDELKELRRILEEYLKTADKMYYEDVKKDKNETAEDKKEEEDLSRKINALKNKTGNPLSKEGVKIEKREVEQKTEDSEENKGRGPDKEKRKKRENKYFELKLVHAGASRDIFSYYLENQKTVIELNKDHIFFERYNRNDDYAKETILIIFDSMITGIVKRLSEESEHLSSIKNLDKYIFQDFSNALERLFEN